MISDIYHLYDQDTKYSTLIIQDSGCKYNIVIKDNITFGSPLFFAQAALYYMTNRMSVARNIAKLYMYNLMLGENVKTWMKEDVSYIEEYISDYKQKYYNCVVREFNNLINRRNDVKL